MLLYRYAMAAEKEPADPEEILMELPDLSVLSPDTRMAYRFLAETIQRDTEKWKTKQQRYQEAAARRTEEGNRKPGFFDRKEMRERQQFVEAFRAKKMQLD